MTKQKIGSQLDQLGLTVDMENGDRVAEAVVTVTTYQGEGMLMHHTPIRVPTPEPRPVPYPVERRVTTVVDADQVLSETQQQRLRVWLEANGIDPKFVSTGGSITVHSRAVDGSEGAYRIRYTEYCRDEKGHKFMDPGAGEAATVERCVLQSVPLDEDPEVPLQ
ncbi:hypothetical protein [Streptomyces sp. NPDC048445]|uniref:hypothetical protein n=1 Tax=Streptomyces sp. NPDC048445 TaxID=3365553 RepID=UPI00371A4D56